MAAPSHGATINESSVLGGDFSSLYLAPTVIGSGNTYVNGSFSTVDTDYLLFNHMRRGASTVTITIIPPAGKINAHGTVYYSTTPFSLTNLGTSAGKIKITPGQSGQQTITFTLGSSFAGSLYLSLNLSLGPIMRYSVYVPSNLPGIPVPAPVFMLGAAVAGLGALSRRRRRGAV